MTAIDTAAFKKDGFLLLRGFFDKAQVEQVRRDAQLVFLTQMERRGLAPFTNLNEAEFEAAAYKYFQDDVEEFASCGKQDQHLLSLHRMSTC